MKEKTADEMFEELSFRKEYFKDIYGNVYSEAYTKNSNYIEFILSNKKIVFDNAYENPVRFDFNEFKLIGGAINKKAKELGWYE